MMCTSKGEMFQGTVTKIKVVMRCCFGSCVGRGWQGRGVRRVRITRGLPTDNCFQRCAAEIQRNVI